MPYLIQKSRDGSLVKQWDLKGRPLSIGRGDTVDAQIDDQEMSRFHFMISPKGNAYLITDQESSNGTWVNGQRVSEVTLKPNDRIQAGQTNFVFVEGLGTYLREISNGDKP